MINTIILLILICILYIIYREYYFSKKKEHFQIETIRNFRKKIQKINKRNKKKEIIKEKENEEYEDPSKKFLYNNRIVITGGTGGIGYYIAKMLNKHKPKLVICGKSKEKVDKIVEELKKDNERVYGIAINLTKKNGVDMLVDRIFKIVKNVDILINNAITKKGSRFLISKDSRDWKDEISVNINSCIILSQRIASKMKYKKNEGRIINISYASVKDHNTKLNSGSEILMGNMIEKFSKLLSEEVYTNKIGVTTIRIDHNLDLGRKLILHKTFNTNNLNRFFGKLLGEKPQKVMPVFMYAIKAPFHEISGKIISTKAFLENEKLSKIIAPHNLNLNKKLYSQIKFTKNDSSKTYLVKQNPFDMSPRVTKIINKKNINKFNTISKYKPVLDSIIAKNLNIHRKNIVFYKTEYDCIKKIIEIFVPKYQDIIVVQPNWSYLHLVINENKINYVPSILKENLNNNKMLEPNFNQILSSINSKTKLIYLSSPNIVSGQHILKDEFNLFIKKVPKNIIVLIDQRYIEFTSKSVTKKENNILNALNYIDNDNIIVIRTFNNFYSIENLELTYTLSNKDIAKVIRESQIINPIDNFIESIAMSVYKDKYYDDIKKKIKAERKRIMKAIDDSNIEYYLSDTNYFLVRTPVSKDEVAKDLENRGLILYNSDDSYKQAWTLPISTPDNNTKIIDALLYSDL